MTTQRIGQSLRYKDIQQRLQEQGVYLLQGRMRKNQAQARMAAQ